MPNVHPRPRRLASLPTLGARTCLVATLASAALAGCGGGGARSVVVDPPGSLVLVQHLEQVPFGGQRVARYEIVEAGADGRVALDPPRVLVGSISTRVLVSAPGRATTEVARAQDDETIALAPVADGRAERRAIAEARRSSLEFETACSSGTLNPSRCAVATRHLDDRAAHARLRWPASFDPARAASPIAKPFGTILVDSWRQLRDGAALLESGVELADGSLALLEASLDDLNLDVADRTVVVLGTDHRVRFAAVLEGAGAAALAAWGEGGGVVGITNIARTSWDARGERVDSVPLDPPLQPHERVKDAVAIGPWIAGKGDLLVAVHHVLERSNGGAAPLRLDRYDARGKRVASRPVPEVVWVQSLSASPNGGALLFGDGDYAKPTPPAFTLPAHEGHALRAAGTAAHAVFEVPPEPAAPVAALGSGLDAFVANDAGTLALVLDAQPSGKVGDAHSVRRTLLLRGGKGGSLDTVADRTHPELRREDYRLVRPRPGSTRAVLVFHRDLDDRGGDVIELAPP